MGTGYTRNDTANNIADGNVIDAADLDGEFDAVEAAFNSSTGHTHDGTSAEGAAITVLGPTQEFVATANEVRPSTNNGLNIGTALVQFNDLYASGTATLGDILIDDGATIGSDSDADAITISSGGNVTFSQTATVDVESATTNAVINTLTLKAQSSGTPAVGIGTGMQFQVETAAGNVETGGAIRIVTTGLTPTDEEVDLVFYSMRNGSLTEAFRFDSDLDTLDITGTLTVDAGSSTGTHLEITTSGNGHNFDMVDGSATARIRNVGGVLRIGADDNDEAADSYIRFDVDNSEAMRIDSSGNVGIGESSPSANLHLKGSGQPIVLRVEGTDSGANNGPILDLYRNSSTPAADDSIGEIYFSGEDDGGGKHQYAKIEAFIEDATDGAEKGRLTFNVLGNGGGSQMLTLRGDTGGTDGQVVINEPGNDVNFRIEGSSESNLFVTDAASDVVIVGHHTAQGIGSATPPPLQVVGTTGATSSIGILRNQNTSSGPALRFARSRASTKGDVTIVQDNDQLGSINFYGADGTDIASIGAQIIARVDGTPGVDDMPGSLEFWTTADGANTGTQRMVIDSAGNIGINETDPVSLLHITSNSTSNPAMFQLECTNDSASTGPDVYLLRNSPSPADNDYLGSIHFAGKNSADETIIYATHYAKITDVTDGTEDSRQEFYIRKNNSLSNAFQIGATEAVFNEDSKDIDFRVESGNDTAAFFVDGSNSNVGMSVTDPAGHIPVSFNAGKRSFVNFFTGGTQFVAGRSDTAVVAGDYVGGYLFKTNDAGADKFGGMIATCDDGTGNANLEFYPVANAYENGSEGSMQLDDAGDIYLRNGGIRVGRSHGNVYTSTEEAIIIYHTGSGSNDTTVRMQARDGTAGDYVWLHERRGVTKSEIEENGDFRSATNSYGGTSDKRLKENITACGSQWDDIKAVQVKKYSWIEEGLDAPNQLGVIAQDLQAAGMGGLVKQHFKKDDEDNPVLDADGNQIEHYSVKYSILYMKAVKALQEAMERIETLETEQTAIKARLDALEAI